MRKRTHLLFSLFIFALLLRFQLFSELLSITYALVLFFGLLLFFTLVPDIDTPESYLGRRMFPLSWILSFVFGHRRFFHSLLFAGLVFAIPWFFGFHLFALAALLGILSHLFMDALTSEGVYPLYPLLYRIHGPIPTGGILEFVFSLFLILAILLVLL